MIVNFNPSELLLFEDRSKVHAEVCRQAAKLRAEAENLDAQARAHLSAAVDAVLSRIPDADRPAADLEIVIAQKDGKPIGLEWQDPKPKLSILPPLGQTEPPK